MSFGCLRTTDELKTEIREPNPSTHLVPLSWRTVPPFGNHLLHVDAERIGPRKSYPLSETLARRADFGVAGEYALNYLHLHQNNLLPPDDYRCSGLPSNRKHRLIDVVNHWLQGVTPGAHLELETVPAADALIAGFSFDRPGDVASRRFRATNVGFGLSYTLPRNSRAAG